MGGRVAGYRTELRALRNWEPYLKKHSGLPGPRANLELVQAVGDEADPELLWRLSASSDEFLALCGTAGLGRLASTEHDTVMVWLRELASDPRWRVREGVAIALQRVGRQSMPKLIADMKIWAKDGAFVQRAAAAGLCERALLKDPEQAGDVLAILDQITTSLAAAGNRREESVRVLRQALGYCWSVAAAAAPEKARPLLEKWLRSTDPDVAWVMKTNLGKARMAVIAGSLDGASAKRPAEPKSRAKAVRKPPARATRGTRAKR